MGVCHVIATVLVFESSQTLLIRSLQSSLGPCICFYVREQKELGISFA